MNRTSRILLSSIIFVKYNNTVDLPKIAAKTRAELFESHTLISFEMKNLSCTIS